MNGPIGRRLRHLAPLLCCAALGLGGGASAAAAPAPLPDGDGDAGGFRDILPPGTNGSATTSQLTAFLAGGARPPHNDDQLGRYADLVSTPLPLSDGDLDRLFKDATFGVRADEVASVTSPRDDVTIVRDRAFGVPRVYGATRAGTMFGAGWVAAEDRLFFIDVLRHLGAPSSPRSPAARRGTSRWTASSGAQRRTPRAT